MKTLDINRLYVHMSHALLTFAILSYFTYHLHNSLIPSTDYLTNSNSELERTTPISASIKFLTIGCQCSTIHLTNRNEYADPKERTSKNIPETINSNTICERVRLVILMMFVRPQAKGDFGLRMNYALNLGYPHPLQMKSFQQQLLFVVPRPVNMITPSHF
jgi:hypothetical protein